MITDPFARIVENHYVLMRPNILCKVQTILKSVPAAINQKYCLKDSNFALTSTLIDIDEHVR